jgi:hypothetical protein
MTFLQVPCTIYIWYTDKCKGLNQYIIEVKDAKSQITLNDYNLIVIDNLGDTRIFNMNNIYQFDIKYTMQSAN